MAVVAREAGEEMLDRMDWVTIQPKVIIDMGCGPGEMSSRLQKRYPDALVLALDSAEPMIQYAKQFTTLTTCVCADGLRLPLRDQTVDLIFANFFLPWQLDFVAVLREWRRVLRKDGVLMLTALGPDTLQECKTTLEAKYLPQLLDVHDLGDILLEQGFIDPVLDVSHYTLLYKEKAQWMNELCSSGMWFPNEEARLSAMMSTMNLEVTYEVIYVNAFASAVGTEFTATTEGIVKIPLAHLRQQFREKK